tara:strand:- start:14649 stop:15035 length:387 start_codon:yes stop_codon:yes gene_type:complete
MKLEKNFSLHEFRCKDGTDVPEEFMCNVQQLCMNLQVLRDHINKPITIISGYRSPEYNKKIKGAKRSQHLLAKAADIVVAGMTSLEVRDIIIQLIKEEKMDPGGVGIYPTFVHYDVRGRNARWGSYKK